jgi:hypothetical protein
MLTAGLAATAARAEEMKVPQTAAEHRAMAKSYEEKVAAWRAEAAYHREMAAAYKRAHAVRKSGAVNPWAVEMEKHCMNIVKDVQKAASGAEEFARFHHLDVSDPQLTGHRAGPWPVGTARGGMNPSAPGWFGSRGPARPRHWFRQSFVAGRTERHP